MWTLRSVWPNVPPEPITRPAQPKDPPRLCAQTGKHRHASKRVASRAKRSLYHKNPDCYLEVYHCRGCGDWHVGNADMRVPR